MKNRILKLAGLFVLFIIPMALMAQDRGQGRGQGDREARAKQQKEELVKAIDLKKDQVKSFDKIYADYDKKRTDMMASMRDGGDREGMREKMTKMNTEREAAIKKILSKDQVKKYEAYLKKQAEARQNRGGRGGGDR